MNYNPNHYARLVDTVKGWQVGLLNQSNIITNHQDEILCTIDDNHKYKFFTECLLDMRSAGDYNLGDKVNIGSVNWFILEKEENKNVDIETDKRYSYIVAR